MKTLYLLVTVAIVSAVPRGAPAQQPDYRLLHDSIARVNDVAQLRRLEFALPLPRTATGLEPLVRRGLIALRLYALTQDRADAERARDVFEVAVERFPSEPWSHYGLALAFARGPDARLPLVGGLLPQVTLAQSVAEIFGRDAHSRARRAARAALAIDAGCADAAILLAELALADGRRRELLSEARAALRAARAAGASSAELPRALADIETALGNYAAAAAAAAAGDDAAALRSRGIALLLQEGHEAEGWLHYQRALEVLDAAAAELFYQDVAVLVNAQEAAEWRAGTTPAARQAWLRRFWERRAAEGGVLPAERVAEHYRRLAFAREHYVRNARRGSENPTGAQLLAAEGGEAHIFDDRGVVLIRHGPPLQAVRSGGNGLLPNESWAYRFPGREELQLFHFVALRGTHDYSLVGDLLAAVEPGLLRTQPQRREQAVMTLIEDRAALEPRYRQSAARLRQLLQRGEPLDGTEVRSILERVEADYRQGARRALAFDSYSPTYAAALDFHSDIFTFRTPFARTDATAAFAIPAAQLERLAGSATPAYALRLSFILTDTLQDLVTRVDTVLTVRGAQAGAADGFVRAHLTMPVVPSEHTVYRLVAADAVGERGAQQAGGVRLRDYSSNRLQVSDVVLALPDSTGDWQRGPVSLALVLPRRFGGARPFTVFYEIYNLPAETPYLTEVSVAPARSGGIWQGLKNLVGMGRDRISLRFEALAQPGPDGVVQEIRRLASELAPGDYRLEITVTNRASGESAATRTAFTVQE